MAYSYIRYYQWIKSVGVKPNRINGFKTTENQGEGVAEIAQISLSRRIPLLIDKLEVRMLP